MKGIQGLIVAIGLGIAAALFNWAYLNNQASTEKTVSFVGIQAGQTVNRGEVLRDDHLVELTLPDRWAGNLKEFAVLTTAKQTVIGRPVWRTLTGECLLLNDDLKTPPQTLKLDDDEQIMWIPVDSRAFVPSLVSPGDDVMFLVPRITRATPGQPATEAVRPEDSESFAALSAATSEIGPFRVRALGNRLGSPQVWAAAKIPQLQENVVGISVKPENKKKAVQLWDVLKATDYRQVGIEKLGPQKK